jgi:hypothetical protein
MTQILADLQKQSYIAERDVAQLVEHRAVNRVVLVRLPADAKVMSLVGRQEGHPVRKIISQLQ